MTGQRACQPALHEDEVGGGQLVDCRDAGKRHLEVGAAVAIAVDLKGAVSTAGGLDAGVRPATGEGGLADEGAGPTIDLKQDLVAPGAATPLKSLIWPKAPERSLIASPPYARLPPRPP